MAVLLMCLTCGPLPLYPVDGSNAYDAGYVAQFGLKGSSRRVLINTRAESITGVTGKGGWYLHWSLGVPLKWSIVVDTIPRGTSIILATRYACTAWASGCILLPQPIAG